MQKNAVQCVLNLLLLTCVQSLYSPLGVVVVRLLFSLCFDGVKFIVLQFLVLYVFLYTAATTAVPLYELVFGYLKALNFKTSRLRFQTQVCHFQPSTSRGRPDLIVTLGMNDHFSHLCAFRVYL